MSTDDKQKKQQISPVAQLPTQDIGAETIRNFSYQWAYTVVLLIAAAARKKNYIAMWCEQEDDILAQIGDKTFDAYQVKTRKPEDGPWNLTDDSFVSAVKGFLRLDNYFPGRFGNFYFVTNVESSESDAKKITHLSPHRLISRVGACGAITDLDGQEKKGFEALCSKITDKFGSSGISVHI